MQIRPFECADEAAVIELWRQCDLLRPWNDPHQDIARKLQVRPEWFLVGILDGELVASVMAGYDGHRGWLYYVGVLPAFRQRGLARQIIAAAEALLLAAGCPKINLQVRDTNHAALDFYRRIGFKDDTVLSMGKRLIEDQS